MRTRSVSTISNPAVIILIRGLTCEDRRKIYEYITDKDEKDLSRIELNYLIMQNLDSELHATYDYEFVREDLKIILEHATTHELAPPQPDSEFDEDKITTICPIQLTKSLTCSAEQEVFLLVSRCPRS